MRSQYWVLVQVLHIFFNQLFASPKEVVNKYCQYFPKHVGGIFLLLLPEIILQPSIQII